MTLAATFLGGAKGRLLPASIPFRFFAAAAVFHVLMWFALALSPHEAADFHGGPGPALAAIHALTLGTLTIAAIGASVQLLPVATRRALAALWPIKLVFWLVVPGTLVLFVGMYAAQPALLDLGAGLTSIGLFVFAALLADNLRRADALPVVAAYGWAALASLLVLAALGFALALDFRLGALPNHRAVALAHMLLGGFGFMGMLALGFSHVLVPMFALAAAPAKRSGSIGFFMAAAAIVMGSAGALLNAVWLLTGAALIGLSAALFHLWLMHRLLVAGMRKRLGLSFVLIRFAWLILPLTLLVGIAALYDLAGPNGPTLFGFMLIGGWLLTFLLGILQRILPFLASMHAVRSPGGAPLLVSELAAAAPLKVHASCHVCALAVLASAIATDSAALFRVGTLVGLIGAVAFAWFTGQVLRKLMGEFHLIPSRAEG